MLSKQEKIELIEKAQWFKYTCDYDLPFTFKFSTNGIEGLSEQGVILIIKHKLGYFFFNGNKYLGDSF